MKKTTNSPYLSNVYTINEIPNNSKNFEDDSQTTTNDEKQISWSNLLDIIETKPIEIKKPIVVKRYEIEDNDQLQISKQNICEICDIPFSSDSDGSMFCSKCGLEFKDTSGSVPIDLSKPSFTQMKIHDAGNRNRNRKSLFRSTANYEQYQTKNTLNEFFKACSQGINGKFIPRSILNEANKLFQKIRSVECQVFRKCVKLGLMSACVSYVMTKNNISRPPTDISQQFGIEHKFHSRGDTLIQQMIENGIIESHRHSNPIMDYIKMYIEMLKIDNKYCDFVYEIIQKAEEQRLHVLFDSKNNTKCIGAIWFLIEQLNLQITKEHIAKVCEISKTTFFKYYSMICTYYKMFVPVMVKHKIPLKAEWRNDIYMFYGKSTNEQKIRPLMTNLVCTDEVKVPIIKKSMRKRNLVMNFGLVSPKHTPTQTPRISAGIGVSTPFSIISGSMSRRSSISSNISLNSGVSLNTFTDITTTRIKRQYKRKAIKPRMNLDQLDILEKNNTKNPVELNISPATTLSPESPAILL